jgi:hypothetical protein
MPSFDVVLGDRLEVTVHVTNTRPQIRARVEDGKIRSNLSGLFEVQLVKHGVPVAVSVLPRALQPGIEVFDVVRVDVTDPALRVRTIASLLFAKERTNAKRIPWIRERLCNDDRVIALAEVPHAWTRGSKL